MRPGLVSIAHWALAAALVVFAVAGLWTIGWFIMPFAVWACYHASARYRFFPEGISGCLFGAGAVNLFLAFLHRDYSPCPQHIRVMINGHIGYRCGGFDPMPFLTTGAWLVGAGFLIYASGRLITPRTHSRA